MPLSRLPGRALLFVLATAAPLAAQSHRLGTIAFPNSGPKAAQPPFIRGVLLLHSFEYDDAAAAFREAQRLAPGFVLAYWGEAMTQTHPVWNQQEVDSARAILARLGPTPEARSARARTRRERGYLEAVEILYGDGSKPRRDTLYSAAMGRLAAAYPSDLEARAFYALSLLGLGQGTRNVPTYMRAGALAEEVLRRNPDHPGAAHYVIHAFDDPAHAPLGLPAARAYSSPSSRPSCGRRSGPRTARRTRPWSCPPGGFGGGHDGRRVRAARRREAHARAAWRASAGPGESGRGAAGVRARAGAGAAAHGVVLGLARAATAAGDAPSRSRPAPTCGRSGTRRTKTCPGWPRSRGRRRRLAEVAPAAEQP